MLNNNNESCVGYDPIEELGNAIVIQAVRDYRYGKATGNTHLMKECERFFLSDWCAALTRVSGEVILEKLKAEDSYKKIKWNVGY